MIELKKLPYKVGNNIVLVEINNEFDDGCTFKTAGGLELVLSGGDYEKKDRLPRHGTVVFVPDKLTTRTKSNQRGMEWECDMDVMIGDIVYFGVMCSNNSPKVNILDKTYLVINYSDIILVIRNRNMIPINGYVLLTEKKKKIDTSFINPFDNKQDKKRGIVHSVGKPNKRYLFTELMDAEVSAGDEVIFRMSAFTFLEDSMFRKLEERIGYIQGRWIIAKE